VVEIAVRTQAAQGVDGTDGGEEGGNDEQWGRSAVGKAGEGE
jgi:hypothetical protein